MSTTPAPAAGKPDTTLKRAGDVMEANPLAVLAGGAAIGILAGAILPRSERETELLGPIGRRVTAAATAAATAARETGLQQLEAHGISGKAARRQIGELLDGVVEAASTAGEAAATAAAAAAAEARKSAD